MAFKGITFAGQNVTPKNDGGLYQAHHGDGILWGCSMAISGDDLVIQSGEFIAGGRVCWVDGATSVDLSGRTLQTGYIQVIMNYDLSQSEGSQWYTTFVESATTTFPALTQGNINNNDTLYQFQMAVVQISGGNLTNVTSQMTLSPLVFINANGDIQGKIRLTASNFVMAGTEDANGNVVSGLRVGEEETILSAEGEPIQIRPNGMYSAVGQTLFNTDGSVEYSGQRKGGITVTPVTINSKSCPVNANTSVVTVTSLDSSGLYLAMAQITYTMSGSQTGGLYFNWYRSNGNAIGYDLKSFSNRGAPVFMGMVWFRGSTSVELRIEPSVAGSAQGYIDVLRIG